MAGGTCRAGAGFTIILALVVGVVWFFLSARPPSNHYEVLNVARDATSQQIRKAFRTQSLVLHPDKAGHRAANDATGSDEFLALVEARDVLLDASKRAEYDARLAHEEAAKAREPSPWLTALRSPRAAFWHVVALANGGVAVHVPDYITIWLALFALAVAAMLLDWVLPVAWHAVTCRYCRSGARRSSTATVRSGSSTTSSAMGGDRGERRGVGLTGEAEHSGGPADELRRVRLLQQAAYDEKVAKEARRRPASRRSRMRR